MMDALTIPDSVNYHPDALRRFNNDVADHAMTIAHEHGLYRHLRFKKPGTIMYWFDIITSPGLLTINGDMGTFVFSRTEDMFGFFSHDVYVNAGYWAEKLRAAAHRGPRQHEEDHFVRFVLDDFWERRHEYEPEDARLIWDRIRAQILDGFADRSSAAACIELLNRFEYRGTGYRFQYDDPWDHDFTEYTYQYLWCCHAILWGIQQYKTTKQKEA